MIESVSGRNYNFGLPQLSSGVSQSSLTRGPSGSSIGTPITDVDENELDWKKYGSNHSLSLGLTTHVLHYFRQNTGCLSI